jgi:hypothetical protein
MGQDRPQRDTTPTVFSSQMASWACSTKAWREGISVRVLKVTTPLARWNPACTASLASSRTQQKSIQREWTGTAKDERNKCR